VNRTEGTNLRVTLRGAGPDDRFRALSALLESGFEVAWNDPAAVALEPAGRTPEAVVAAAREARERAGARRLEDWKPWFPVIDYDRCTNCMQCLTFCLFEVYGVDANDRITVQNRSNCKTD
jgi:Pyruvate/2-oxoacid:ferredoxin oxidoreductase delta subunit